MPRFTEQEAYKAHQSFENMRKASVWNDFKMADFVTMRRNVEKLPTVRVLRVNMKNADKSVGYYYDVERYEEKHHCKPVKDRSPQSIRFLPEVTPA